MSALLRDAWRAFLHRPLAVAARLCVLAAGVSVAAAASLVAYAALLGPLPHPHADRLYAIWNDDDRTGRRALDAEVPKALRQHPEVVEGAASYAEAEFQATVPRLADAPRALQGAHASVQFMELLGAAPVAGRSFHESDFESHASPSVIISERLSEHLPRLEVGQLLVLSGTAHRVVGVLPSSFAFPDRSTVFWVPLRLPAGVAWSGSALVRVTPRAAHSAKAALESALSGSRASTRLQVSPIRRILLGGATGSLLFLQIAALALLILTTSACAFGLSADTWHRQSTFAIKAALGAGARRIAAEYCLTSALLAISAAFLAVAFKAAIVDVVLGGWQRYLPHVTVGSGLSSIVACAGFAWFCVAAAAAPGSRIALRATLVSDIRASLQPPRFGLARHFTLVAEVALVFGLCATAVWAGLSLRSVLTRNVGVVESDVLVLRMDWPEALPLDAHAFAARIDALQAELRSAGLRAGITSSLPLSRTDLWHSVRFRDGNGRYQDDYEMVRLRVATPEFTELIGLGCLQGACLPARQGDSLSIAVSDAFRRRYWPHTAALGSTLKTGGREWTVTGLTASLAHNELGEVPQPEVFVDYRNMTALGETAARFAAAKTFILLDRRAAKGRAGAAWTACRRQFPEAYFEGPTLFSAMTTKAAGYRPLLVACSTLLACVAAAVLLWNLHSLIGRELNRRRREFAIRQALGGTPARILSQHFWWEAVDLLAGALLGALLSYWAVALLRSKQFVPSSYSVPQPMAVALAALVPAALLCGAVFAIRVRQLDRADIALIARSEHH